MRLAFDQIRLRYRKNSKQQPAIESFMKHRCLGLLLLLASMAACDKTKPADKTQDHRDADGQEHKKGDGHDHKEGDAHKDEKK